MSRSCGYCGGAHSIDHCTERLEAKFGTSANPTKTGEELQEGDEDE